MNFDRSLILSYIEEDNIQRAYFRVKPLLSLDGDVQQEALQLWPNEGGLRIIPDRNEQHTFKVRMRQLGSYCVVDLRDQPAEAGKIRTNKNFRPDRGEVNQYILYSDTVHELPQHTFYQLASGNAEDYADLAKTVITPLFYIRQEDTLFGPIQRENPVQPSPAQESSGVLFEITCPDGVQRMILCMEDAPVKAAPAEEAVVEAIAEQEITPAEDKSEVAKPAEETTVPDSLPIGQPLTILDSEKSHEDTIKQLDKPVSSEANLLHQKAAIIVDSEPRKEASLGGTPLTKTPVHVSSQQTKNVTQEIVTNQWSIGKYVPPTQNLPSGASMREVKNPVETACNAMREAWNASGTHDQLMDCMLSLEGLRSQMEVKLCKGEHVTLMQKVLLQRLQDLEAERLTALCELDRAHRDLDAYKQELINGLSTRIQRETSDLEAVKSKIENQVIELKTEINSLLVQRNSLAAKVHELQTSELPAAVAKIAEQAHISMPATGIPLRISPVAGSAADVDEMISRVVNCGSACGISIDRNTAIAVLVLLAGSSRLGVACPTTAAASTLIRNLICALGWRDSYAHQISAEQHPMVGMRPLNTTPAILTTSLPNYAPMVEAKKLLLNRNTVNLIRNAAYDASQWPILMLPALPFIDECDAVTPTPISQSALESILHNDVDDCTEISTVIDPILKTATPLSGAARRELIRFISSCAGLMEGGLPVAVDWGILLWIIPGIERGSRQYSAVKALLDEYPLSRNML